MITATDYAISSDILQEAIKSIPHIDFKLPLNETTEDFFYTPWQIKKEYKGTVWDKVLQGLPELQGEARLIKLDPGTCYYAHADIDDRWHLSLQAEHAFLIDIKQQQMYELNVDGKWYNFDATDIHSAANFGNIPRVQLVVRKLLEKNNISDPVNVEIVLKEYRHDFRYVFDHTVSPWLNSANKKGWLTDFKRTDNTVKFAVTEQQLNSLYSILPEGFQLVCL